MPRDEARDKPALVELGRLAGGGAALKGRIADLSFVVEGGEIADLRGALDRNEGCPLLG